jgi:hypothetical protein
MTINVAIVTGDVLVLGCDSIASTTRHFVDPFARNMQNLGNGRYSIEFGSDDIVPYVSGAWTGVTKMFQIQKNGACVSAVTAGLARLNDRTMASYAAEFMEKQHKPAKGKIKTEVKDVANDFLVFLRKEYTKHYQGSTVPPQYWDGPEFLVGGYGKKDHHHALYRVRVHENVVAEEFTPGNYGISWAGQSDAVVRLVRGYDIPLRVLIEQEVQKAVDTIYDTTSDAVRQILQDVLDRLQAQLPNGANTTLPPKPTVNLSWDKYELPLYCKNWPIQDAIDFASFLVNMQSARSKFVPGIATVGGRAHIGVMTKAGFNMLNEPELKHKNVGFINDL